MFEKEAEDIIQRNIKLDKTPRETVYDAYEEGYNKANVCHYPSMGEFPETSGDMHKDWKPVLIYTKELGWTVGMRFKKNRKYEWYCSNYDGNTIFLDEEIIAWKELPETPKEG